MKTIYKIFAVIAISILVVTNLNAQERIVVIEPDAEVNLNDIINADTNAVGEWNDTLNTVYELKRDGIYYVSKQINVKGTKLHIRGQEGAGSKAAIYQRVKEEGGYNKVLYTQGDAIIENVLLNAQEGGSSYSWNAIRAVGENSTVLFKNCIIEKQGGAFVAVYGSGIDLTIEACEGRYLGQPATYGGNGRIVDGRAPLKSCKVVDSYFYNIASTLFSGWSKVHGTIEFDHNTFVNCAGNNRLFQWSTYVDSVKVTNNIFQDCFIAGDHPSKLLLEDKLVDAKWSEYGQDTEGTLAIFYCPDSLPAVKTQWQISNNNVYYTDAFNTGKEAYPDSVTIPPVLSPNFAGWLGETAAANVFFTEVLEFVVPAPPVEFYATYYADPTTTSPGMFVPDHPLNPEAGYYTFDPATLDLSYCDTAKSATAGTDGGPIGSRLFPLKECGVGVNSNISNTQSVTAFPNPAQDHITFKIGNVSNGTISIYNLLGVKLETIHILESNSVISCDLLRFSKGTYLYELSTSNGSEVGKFVIK